MQKYRRLRTEGDGRIGFEHEDDGERNAEIITMLDCCLAREAGWGGLLEHSAVRSILNFGRVAWSDTTCYEEGRLTG